MSLPVVMYQQRDPRCVLDSLHATVSLARPLAYESTATETVYRALIYVTINI